MIFKNTKNTRCIIENNYHYIRSDVPVKISESEIRFLISHQILMIIDLIIKGELLWIYI